MSCVITYQAFVAISIFLIGFFVLLKKPLSLISRVMFTLSTLIAAWVGANLLLEYDPLALSNPV